MTSLTLIPDPERVIADYLRDQPDVLAITEQRRVGSKTPASTDLPWIRYTAFDAPAVGDHRADHLIAAFVQFDCYAGREGGQPQASLLARTVRAALTALGRGEGTVSGAVVTGVRIRGFGRRPDPQLDNRERFIVDTTIWMHP